MYILPYPALENTLKDNDLKPNPRARYLITKNVMNVSNEFIYLL